MLALLLLLGISAAFYNPESGDDWTLFKPDSTYPGSLSSVDFTFGIVIKPYGVDGSGAYVEPTFSLVQRLVTTLYTTTTVVPAAKLTKLVDVVQIHDGQVQRWIGEAGQRSGEQVGQKAGQKVGPEVGQKVGDADDEVEVIDTPYKRGLAEERDEGFFYEPTENPVYAVACSETPSVAITLRDGVLRDAQGRIGLIVLSRQFQFDGPPPQYGTLYAAGWLVTPRGTLALGNQTEFYQCMLGSFYNLYDASIAPQCSPVMFEVVEIVSCDP